MDVLHKGGHRYFLDIGLEIQRHVLRLRLAVALNMMTNILGDRDSIKEYLREVCCVGVQDCNYCSTKCLVDRLGKSIQEVLSEINSEEFSLNDILGSCKFNTGNPDIDDLKQKLSNDYSITLLMPGIERDLRHLVSHHRVRQNLCDSTNISNNTPSIVYSATNLIMRLLGDIVLLLSLPHHSSKFNDFEPPQNPLWIHAYRYFIKQTILCRNNDLPYKIDIKVWAHKHNLEIPYLLVHYLVYEDLIYGQGKDVYVDFDSMVKAYRKLYLKYSSTEIIRSLTTLHQKLNQVGKNRDYDNFLLSIVDYINERAEASKNLYKVLGENLGLEKDEVECLCYVTNLLKSSNLLNLIRVADLPKLLYNLPYQLLYMLLIVSAISYQWLVLPSASIRGNFWQEDKSQSGENQEIDALLLGFLPEVHDSKIAFTPSIVALEIKLTDISQQSLENKSFSSLLSNSQLKFLDTFNKDCRESYSYDIKCVAAIAIPCRDVEYVNTSSSIPTICLENLVSESSFLTSIIDLFGRFYKNTISTQLSDTSSSSVAQFWSS